VDAPLETPPQHLTEQQRAVRAAVLGATFGLLLAVLGAVARGRR
jgi:hypothetical protein